MIGYLAGSLSPLHDPSGNPIYATGSGVQLYEDDTGTIVDVSGNDQDPLTGNPYQDEVAGPYTAAAPVAPIGVLASGSPTAPSAGQSPAGSQWRFQGAWTSSLADPLAGLSAQTVISQLGAAVAPDFSIVASTPNPATQVLSGSISVSLVDNTGHALITDGQSVIQNAFAKIVGSGNVQSNSAQLIAAGPSSGGVFTTGASNPTPPSSISNFFSSLLSPSPSTPSSGTSPWVWILIAGVGLIAIGVAVKK